MNVTAADHTWVICAYKESPYLEECIRSLLAQTVTSPVIIATSTPNGHIAGLAKRYGLPLRVNDGPKGIAGDWNFAYSCAGTALVTIAHQDDCYEPDYLEACLKRLSAARRPLIYFTDYAEIRNGRKVNRNKLLLIKRILLLPMRIKALAGTRFGKRLSLAFGNPICCPSVTYVAKEMPNPPFMRGFYSNLDWQLWERLTRFHGSFEYDTRRLSYHRIHEGSETTRTIGTDNTRAKEDAVMFARFWPAPIVKILMHFYVSGEKSNRL